MIVRKRIIVIIHVRMHWAGQPLFYYTGINLQVYIL